MWLWALVAWLVASGLLVVLHHRFHRAGPRLDPEVAALVLRLETVLAEDHPSVEFRGLLPDQFACLLAVDGQETPVSLHDAFRHEAAFPEAFRGFVARLIEDIRAVGLDRVEDVDLAFVTPHLLPQVRSRQWLEAKGCFGDSGLVYRRLNDELVVVYVVDDAHSMVFLCRAHLQRWCKTVEDIHHIAVANLARLDPSRLEELGGAATPVRVGVGDGFDAARVLLLEQAEDLLVAIPDRDVLWVGHERQADLESLMADTREIAARAPHPISPDVFRIRDGRLEPVAGEPRT